MLKNATKKDINIELTLLTNIWTVLKTLIVKYQNVQVGWGTVKDTVSRLDSIVGQYATGTALNRLAQRASISVIEYISSTSFGTDYTDECSIFNGLADLLKAGYWINYTGEDSDEDWEELLKIAKAIPNSLPRTDNYRNKTYFLASNLAAAVASYLESISKQRFDDETNKLAKVV